MDTFTKMELDQFLIPYTRINSTWIKDLNLRLKTIKFLEENIRSKISDISFSNMFSDISLWAKKTKLKVNKWDYIKQQSFFIAKEITNKMKCQPAE